MIFLDQNYNDIPEPIRSVVDMVSEYVGPSTKDWLVVRKEIIRNLPPSLRSFFKRRHYSSKLPVLGQADYQVVAYWEQKTGIRLLIDESKLHPVTWKKNSKGWGLQKYNNERKQTKP